MEERLYKFAVLVDTANFTKAASKLHISQPALTTSIQKLERELGAELLVRRSHSFTLTRAGSIAYETAKQLHASMQNFRTTIKEAVNEKVLLRIGMIDSIADLLFVKGDQLRVLETSSQLSLTVNNSDELMKQVINDALDFAFVTRPEKLSSSLRVTILAWEPLVLITTAALHDAVLRELKLGNLRSFLSYNQNSRTYTTIEQTFSTQQITLEPTFYSTSPEIMLQLVLAGKGTAVLPYVLVKDHLKSGQLRALSIGSVRLIQRQIVCVQRIGRDLPQVAKQLFADTVSRLKVIETESVKL